MSATPTQFLTDNNDLEPDEGYDLEQDKVRNSRKRRKAHGRRLISLTVIAERLGCSKATARRHSKSDPDFPRLFNVHNRLLADADEFDRYMQNLPLEADQPTVFCTRVENEEEARAK
jgi:hypothetical protein